MTPGFVDIPPTHHDGQVTWGAGAHHGTICDSSFPTTLLSGCATARAAGCSTYRDGRATGALPGRLVRRGR